MARKFSSFMSVCLVTVFTLQANSNDNQCLEFYNTGRQPLFKPAVSAFSKESKEQRQLFIEQYSNQILQAMSVSEGLPTEYFYSSQYRLKRRNGIGDFFEQDLLAANELSNTTPEQVSVANAIEIFQSTQSQLAAKISDLKELSKTVPPKKFWRKDDSKDKKFSLLSDIDNSFQDLLNMMQTLKKKRSLLVAKNSSLSEVYSQVVQAEKNLVNYIEDISQLHEILLIAQTHYSQIRSKIGVITPFYMIERQQYVSKLDQIRALKHNIETISKTNASILAMVNSETNLSLSTLFITHGVSPSAAKEMLDSYQREAPAKKQQQESKANRWAFFKKPFGGKKERSNINDLMVTSYNEAKSSMYQMTDQQIERMKKYRDKASPEIVELVEFSNSPINVFNHLQKVVIQKPVSPEDVVYLANYSPLLRVIADPTKFKLYAQAIYNTFLTRAITREYTPTEKMDMAASLHDLKITIEDYFDLYRINGARNVAELKSEKATLDIYFEERIAFQLKNSDAVVKDQAIQDEQKRQKEIAEKNAQAENEKIAKDAERSEIEFQSKVATARRIDVTDVKILEALAERKVNRQIKLILAGNDQVANYMQLRIYMEKNTISNLDLLYILKRNFQLPESNWVNHPHLLELIQKIKAYPPNQSWETTGEMDLRIATAAKALESAHLEEMNPVEFGLLKEHIDHDLTSRYSENFKIQLKAYFADLFWQKAKIAKESE